MDRPSLPHPESQFGGILAMGDHEHPTSEQRPCRRGIKERPSLAIAPAPPQSVRMDHAKNDHRQLTPRPSRERNECDAYRLAAPGTGLLLLFCRWTPTCFRKTRDGAVPPASQVRLA